MDRYAGEAFKKYRRAFLVKCKNSEDRISELKAIIYEIEAKVRHIVCADMLKVRALVDDTSLSSATDISINFERLLAHLKYILDEEVYEEKERRLHG